MRYLSVACAALIAVIPLGSAAQNSARDCTAQWSAAQEFIGVSATAQFAPSPVGDTGCRVRNASLSDAGISTVEIGQIIWDGGGLRQTLQDGTPPQFLSLTVEDLRFVPQIGDATLDYVFGQQSRMSAVDIRLDLAAAPDKRQVLLKALEIDLPGNNLVMLEGVVDRVDLSSRSSAQMSIGSMALSTLKLRIVNHGFFQDLILPVLAEMLLEGSTTPEADVATLKKQVQAWIATLPDTSFSMATRQALHDLTEDMPQPSGTVTLEINSSAGIGAARLMPFVLNGAPKTPDDIWALFDGAQVDFTYDDSPLP